MVIPAISKFVKNTGIPQIVISFSSCKALLTPSDILVE